MSQTFRILGFLPFVSVTIKTASSRVHFHPQPILHTQPGSKLVIVGIRSTAGWCGGTYKKAVIRLFWKNKSCLQLSKASATPALHQLPQLWLEINKVGGILQSQSCSNLCSFWDGFSSCQASSISFSYSTTSWAHHKLCAANKGSGICREGMSYFWIHVFDLDI